MKKRITTLLLILGLFLTCCNKPNNPSSIPSSSGSDDSSQTTSEDTSSSSSDDSSSESSDSSDSSSSEEEHVAPTLLINEYIYLIGSFVQVEVNPDFHGEAFVALMQDQEVLTSYEYSRAGETIKINFSYLDDLTPGDYLFTIVTAGGEVSFTIHIKSDNYVTNKMLDSERRYTGYVNEEGQPHGFGTLTWIFTNCIYTGEFANGLYSGSGTFEWKNSGDVLIGTWADNAPVHGMLRYANTMRYVGQFKKV